MIRYGKMWIRNSLANCLNSMRVVGSRLASYEKRHSYLKLMYHRILPQFDEQNVEPGMYVTPHVFEEHIRTLKKTFPNTSFHKLSSNKSMPLCSITFDDGWRDFYQYAFPLLKKHCTAATVFLPTSFIGSKKVFWTDRVMTIFSKSHDKSFCKNENIGKLSTIPQHVINLIGVELIPCSVVIDYLKSYKHGVIDSVLDELEEFMGIDLKKQKRTFLNWEEVREMKESGLVQFGSHTHNHAILTTLDRSEVRYELERSRDILCAHGVVDPDFIPFCYPNGNFNDGIALMVKDVGYSLAVTTRHGWNETNSDMFYLNRVGLHNDISYTPSLFLSRVAGLL